MMKAIMRDEREMKDSGIEWIGGIPKEWNTIKIKYCTECLDGRRIPVDSNERISGPYPYWGAGKIVDYVNDYIFDEPLILLGEDGAPFFDDTRPVSHRVIGKVWVNNHIHVLREKDNMVGEYIVHSLNSVDYHEYINGSILNKLTQSNMNKISIPNPSFDEQQLIANYLDDRCSKIDTIIAEAKASIEEYKELKESVIYKATNYAKNGELYKKIQLRLICEVYGRIGFKGYTSADQVAEGEGALSFGATHLQNGKVVMNNPVYISWDKYYESPEIMVKKGDILLVQRGSTIGKVAIVDEEFGEATINPSLVLLNNIDINNKFLLYALLSLDVQQKVAMIGSTTAIPMISQAQVKALKIPMPSENEMVSVVCYLDEKISKIDDMISEKQALIEDLEAYKKSLIYEVVTGKRKVVE